MTEDTAKTAPTNASSDSTEQEVYGTIVNQELYEAINRLASLAESTPELFGLINITWADLDRRGRLRDGDVVRATFENIDPNQTEFFLETGPRMWWKMIEVVNDSGQQFGYAKVPGANRTSDTLSFPSDDLETGARLILWRAKGLGVHTRMYELSNLEHVRGKRVRLRWTSD